MEISIFYAWQSDRPVKGNRYLIRNAAQDACKRISEDTSNPYQITLDSDTQGEAGMCDIPNTILKKIVECDIFLADLTLIAASESQPSKFIPNPNVVFELGWAARSKKFGSLIGIVNEAYGEIDSQIFDIKRRASITYDLNSEDAEDSAKRKAVKNSLSESLEKAIRLTIERVVKPRREKQQNSERQSLQAAQAEFTERVAKRAFHGFNQFPAVLTTIAFGPIPEGRFDEIY